MWPGPPGRSSKPDGGSAIASAASSGAFGVNQTNLARTGRLRRLGRLQALLPISPLRGSDRGHPVEDALVEEFLESRREDVRGDVLDLRRETAAAGVFDARERRPLQELPSAAYDCVILAQILQHALDPAAMVADCRRILKTGGVLLATVPSLGGIDSILGLDTDVWRFGEEGLRALLGREFEPQAMNVMARGTRSSAIALLGGLAVDDFSPSDSGFARPLSRPRHSTCRRSKR